MTGRSPSSVAPSGPAWSARSASTSGHGSSPRTSPRRRWPGCAPTGGACARPTRPRRGRTGSRSTWRSRTVAGRGGGRASSRSSPRVPRRGGSRPCQRARGPRRAGDVAHRAAPGADPPLLRRPVGPRHRAGDALPREHREDAHATRASTRCARADCSTTRSSSPTSPTTTRRSDDRRRTDPAARHRRRTEPRPRSRRRHAEPRATAVAVVADSARWSQSWWSRWSAACSSRRAAAATTVPAVAVGLRQPELLSSRRVEDDLTPTPASASPVPRRVEDV